MERLSLPRRNYQPVVEKDTSPLPVPICPELPKNPLPTWVTLPLDAKLPMIPGPRNNVLLYTTNLGEKRHKSTPELDFDLTDPYSQTMSNDYKPLHDPHLKPHLDTAHMRKRLRVGGFITGDGKVLCTLREYNEYRQYLRRINLALDRKRQTPERKSRRRKKFVKAADAEGSHEWRVKKIKERLQQQYDQDKARYQRLMAEDEERHKKVRETQKSRMSEKEKQLHEDQERRHEARRKRQNKENAKKMEMLQRWYEEDEGRRSQTERRRKERDQLRERKLAESWEERRRVQQQTIAQELRLRHLADEVKKTRLGLRERLMRQRRQRQQSIFDEMTKRQRDEREKLEEECAQRIAERMERRTARAKNKRRKGRKGKKQRPKWKSNWDMTQLLLQEFSDTEETPPRSVSTPPMGEHAPQGETRKVVSDHEIREQEMTPREQDEEIEEQYSELKLRDFKELGSDSDALSSLKIKEFLTDGGIPTAGRLTANMGQLIRQNQTTPVEPEDLARVLVEVNNYIASEVIVPACSKVKAKKESKPHRSIRFSMDTEHIFIPYDDDYSSSDEDRGDMDLEDDDLESSSSRLATAVDSLTRVTKGPSSTKEQSTLGALANILCRLLEKLEHGEISPEDADRLARAAQDILGEPVAGLDRSDTSLSSQSSTASMIATEMVRTSMAKVQSELLKQYTPDELNDFYALPPVKATSSELTGMSKFVAETALAMAVESLMSFTDGIISDQMLGKTKVVRSEGDLPLGKSESSESMSCSSDFIMKILTRVLDRVRSEAAAMMPPRPLDGQGTSSGPRSSTSLYVQELLVKAVQSVQTAMASRPVDLLHAPARSDTSLFVMDTLQRVVQEIQRSRTPSATALFVEDLLCKITNETSVSDPNLSWDETYDIHQRRSSASITSIFIRDTLSAVLAEIEKETKSSCATSLFAQEIVCSTLKKCESAVRQEMLPSRKLSELTAAILNSQQCNEDRNMELRKSGVDMTPGYTQSLGEFSSPGISATEILAENLIRTTLAKAQQLLQHGTISAEQVVTVLSKISASSGQVAALDIDGEAVPASNCTSQQAHSYVSAAIDKAVEEMASFAQVNIDERPMEGDRHPSADEVSSFIQSILANAIRELSIGLVDESDIGELEMNLRYSLDALDQGTGDLAEFTRIDDSASDSDFESNDMILKEALASQAEAESLFTNQKDSYIDRNNLGRPQTQDSDSDEEEEVVLQPVYKGEPLHVDPQVARKALGAISVKNLEDMDDPAQALPRNSFRSLVCPDLADVSGLDTSSSSSLRSQLEKASKGTLPSQTRLRLAAASKMAQTPAALETHTEEKITKTKSLQAANKAPSRRSSDTSPYGSPGSSPNPSKVTVNRASLMASSAPSMKTMSDTTRSSTLSKIPLKEKAASPKSSKKSLSGRTSSRSVTNAVSTSQSKLSPKKSSTTKSLADGKASVSSVKKQTSPFKQKSYNSVSSKSSTERRKSNESTKKTSRTSADKVSEDKTPVSTETDVPTVTTSDTTVPAVTQVQSGVIEATPTVDEEVKLPEKKSSQQLPRESGLIEMTTSSNPPSRKRSTASCQSKTSNTAIVTSPSASQRSVNMAPRPSSGFQKTLSGVSLTKNTSPTEVAAAGGSVGEVAQTRSEEDVSGGGAGRSATEVASHKSGLHEEQK